jgi:hypothetical protein
VGVARDLDDGLEDDDHPEKLVPEIFSENFWDPKMGPFEDRAD